MTRSSKLALVTLLAGLLSLASVGTVSADATCTGKAQEHCEQMAAADDAATYHIESIAPVHILSNRGVGQEHFEAMDAGQVTVFSVANPTPTHILGGTGMGQEHFEAMATEPRATDRVADSYYYLPAPGGMWAVLHVQPDGAPVFEDYVSGPPPVVIASDQPCETERMNEAERQGLGCTWDARIVIDPRIGQP